MIKIMLTNDKKHSIMNEKEEILAKMHDDESFIFFFILIRKDPVRLT